MRSEVEIKKVLDSSIKERGVLEKNINDLLEQPYLNEGDLGVVNFYGAELKRIGAKIEALEWVLGKENKV